MRAHKNPEPSLRPVDSRWEWKGTSFWMLERADVLSLAIQFHLCPGDGQPKYRPMALMQSGSSMIGLWLSDLEVAATAASRLAEHLKQFEAEDEAAVVLKPAEGRSDP